MINEGNLFLKDIQNDICRKKLLENYSWLQNFELLLKSNCNITPQNLKYLRYTDYIMAAYTQDDHSDLRKRQEPAAKPWKSMGNGSSTPIWKITELSADFRPFPTSENRNLVERHRKNLKNFRARILLS
jgi:hypothetical protein